ncbi:GNAT family N-acetyltransferase [Natrononativus amylolyticus]|uniref:GNAT family N-acetyltransferase n=1 Tax=Natrononativus amylolyticus TaxID=2963434 RepID=UPI0020CE1A07|nr:GNAT family N-acetyltransferase [Natrononativus amylolyticus]
MYVRNATPADALEIRRILDAAMLEPGDVDVRIREGDVLVAVEGSPSNAGTTTDAADGRIVGAIVLEPGEEADHIAALAVRKRRRDRGIGTALVDAALDRRRRLTANFDERVRPFYESLEFAIEPIDDRRSRGVRSREE